MKYILEIKPEYEDSFKGLMILGAKDSNLFVDTLAVENLEELNSDYINEHFGSLQDDAYHRGLAEGKKAFDLLDAERDAEYQRGLEDAWEAARKVVLSPEEGGMSTPTLFEIFRRGSVQPVFRNYSASQVIEKLKAYEEKQKAEDEIKVGDEVEVLNSGSKYLVSWIAGTSLCGFAHDGVTCRLQPSDVRKTGRHFDIASILKEMQS